MSLSTSSNSSPAFKSPLSALDPLPKFAKDFTSRLNKWYRRTDGKEFTVSIVEPSLESKEAVQKGLKILSDLYNSSVRAVSLKQETENTFNLFEMEKKGNNTILYVTNQGEKIEKFFPSTEVSSDLRSILGCIKGLKEINPLYPKEEEKLEKIAFRKYQEKQKKLGIFSSDGDTKEFANIFQNALKYRFPGFLWNVQAQLISEKSKRGLLQEDDAFFAIERDYLNPTQIYVYGSPLSKSNVEQSATKEYCKIAILVGQRKEFERIAYVYHYADGPTTVDLKDYIKHLFKDSKTKDFEDYINYLFKSVESKK